MEETTETLHSIAAAVLVITGDSSCCAAVGLRQRKVEFTSNETHSANPTHAGMEQTQQS